MRAIIPYVYKIFSLFLLFLLCVGDTSGQESEVPKEQQEAIDFANGLYQREMYENAARQYENFLEDFPESPLRPTALFRRAESLYQHALQVDQSDEVQSKVFLVESRSIFEQFIEENPDRSRLYEALLRLGEVSYKVGDPKKALDALNQVIRETKDSSLMEAALFYAARSHERYKELEKAEARYRQLRSTFPKGKYTGISTYLLAEVLENQGHPDDAVELLKELWHDSEKFELPDDSTLVEDAKLRAAQILYQTDRFEEAAQAYEAYIKNNPEAENVAKAKYGAAWSQYRQKNYARALEIADSLQRQSLPAELSAGILFLRGTCSYQQKIYDDAIIYFREVIADPNAGDYRERAWYQLCWSYYLSDMYEDTLRECKRLLQHGGSPSVISNVHFLMGQCYAQNKEYDNAVESLRLSLSVQPDGEYASEALYLIGDLLYRDEKYSEAAETFENYYESYPNHPRAQDALVWACNALFSAKNYEKAIQSVERLLEAFPDVEERQEFLYRTALAHYQLKNYEESLQTFERLLTSTEPDKRKADALYWQGYIFELQNNREEATKKYARLLDEYPSSQHHDEALLRKALCEYQQEKHEQAYAGFVKVLDTERGNQIPAEVIFWMILHADEQGKHEEALTIAQRVHEVYDKEEIQERARIAIGNQLVALEEWEEVQNNAETFLEHYPESLFKPEIYWTKAKALEGLEKPKEALAWYNNSLEELNKLGNPDPTFAASLYLDRGKLLSRLDQPKEALDSLLRVAIIYDHEEYTPEALYYAIQTHLSLNEVDSARKLYNELQTNYEKSTWREKALKEFGNRFSEE